MKFTTTRKAVLVALIALFTQFSMAQGPGGALKEIADIVASINHFPSDADKAKLMAISQDMNLPEPLRGMATAVSNISHSADADGKALMASIIASAEAPDSAKALAGVIADLSHVASDEAKATLAQHFP